MFKSYFAKTHLIFCITMFAVVSLVALGGYVSGQEAAGPDQRIKELTTKRDALKAEQDFLLFQKTFYESDSKYLVLELSAGKGRLMYRNRILRSFNLERTSKRSKDPVAGIIAMTAKTDGASRNRALLFGNILELHSKKNPAKGGMSAGYRVGKRDLAALYYALEAGAKAYIR